MRKCLLPRRPPGDAGLREDECDQTSARAVRSTQTARAKQIFDLAERSACPSPAGETVTCRRPPLQGSCPSTSENSDPVSRGSQHEATLTGDCATPRAAVLRSRVNLTAPKTTVGRGLSGGNPFASCPTKGDGVRIALCCLDQLIEPDAISVAFAFVKREPIQDEELPAFQLDYNGAHDAILLTRNTSSSATSVCGWLKKC